MRAPLLIQKALEIAAEVRSMGAGLLAALEKGDAEQLALLRQGNEVTLQQLTENVRFLEWQHAQEVTTGLLKVRDSALERYTYDLRLLGQTPNSTTVPAALSIERRALDEENFAEAYATLVADYDLAVPVQPYATLQLAGASSPSNQSGASGAGQLYLIKNEDASSCSSAFAIIFQPSGRRL